MRHLSVLISALICLMSTPLAAQPARQDAASQLSRTPKAVKIFRDCPSCPEMVAIPSGSFDMGSPGAESGRGDDEGPVHTVKVTAFAMGKTEVTRGQFAAFVKSTKYRAGDQCWTLEGGKVAVRKGDWKELRYSQDNSYPIGCINWDDAQAYTKWLSRKTGKQYRLPTEAEWEYAARGNTHTARYWGDSPDAACRYANVADQSVHAQIHGTSSWSVHDCTDDFPYTAPTGRFKPNAFGLNDMLGNVWEWTGDSYHDSYDGAPVNGSAWRGNGEKRLLRGGSWNNGPRNVRASVRNSYKPALRFSFFGFRLARALP